MGDNANPDRFGRAGLNAGGWFALREAIVAHVALADDPKAFIVLGDVVGAFQYAVLAADAFAHMQNSGGLSRENGNDFRKEILSKGNSEDLMENYVDFRGQKPTVDALMKRRGLVE